MSGQRESTLYGSSKHDSVMRWVLPCKIWNSVSMTSFQGANFCRIFHPVMAKRAEAPSYISKDGLEDLTPHSFARASKKFLCKLAQDPCDIVPAWKICSCTCRPQYFLWPSYVMSLLVV